LFFRMLLIGDIFSFATPFCACIFNKHSNALHFILEPGIYLIIFAFALFVLGGRG
jgi:hypothetical protein